MRLESFGKLAAMRRVAAMCVWLALSAAAAQPAPSDLKSLYDAHQWPELNDALEHVKGPALYRGAVAAAFNDPRQAEKILQAVIKSAPRSDEAYEAYEILAHIFTVTGQYQRLISWKEREWAAFPDRDEREQRAEMAPFRGLPDQVGEKPRSPLVYHDEDEGLSIPFSINGKSASYYMDTGAGVSCMTESEAKQFGLTIRETVGKIGTSTGNKTEFRTTVAGEVIVGSIHLRNVSFAVFPDDQEPWNLADPGHRGLLGLPVLLAFRTLRWAKGGTVEIGSSDGQRDLRRSNLYFDEDKLILVAGFQQRKLPIALDTGAQSTELYDAFAKEFAGLLSQSGKKDSTEGRGVGNTQMFESITLLGLIFRVGGFDTRLRPAHVLLKQIGPKWLFGNVGMDLLKQAGAFKIDFDAMTLDLVP